MSTRKLIAYLASYDGEQDDGAHERFCRFCGVDSMLGNDLVHKSDCPALEAKSVYANWYKDKAIRTVGFAAALAVVFLVGSLFFETPGDIRLTWYIALVVGYSLAIWGSWQ